MNGEDIEDRQGRREVFTAVAFHALLYCLNPRTLDQIVHSSVGDPQTEDDIVRTSMRLGAKLAEACEQANAAMESDK